LLLQLLEKLQKHLDKDVTLEWYKSLYFLDRVLVVLNQSKERKVVVL